jgi:formylglycine-generating enzyme required for sulfatase activity
MALNRIWPRVPVPDLFELRSGTFDYRAAGEFARDGNSVTAPIMTATITRTLAVMRHQVTAADYRRCVETEACPMVDRDSATPTARWSTSAGGTPMPMRPGCRARRGCLSEPVNPSCLGAARPAYGRSLGCRHFRDSSLCEALHTRRKLLRDSVARCSEGRPSPPATVCQRA